MPRAWLLPIGRLHRLVGRELATGCRSRRDSSLPDQMFYFKTCTSLEDAVGWTSPFVKVIPQLKDLMCYSKTCTSPEDTVGWTSPFVKDGSITMEDSTYAPMYQFTSEPAKATIAHLKARHKMKAIAPLKGGACSFGSTEAQYLKYKLRIPSKTQTMFCESNPRATTKVSNQILPLVARRSFSSSPGPVQNSSAYGSGDRNLFLENLESAENKLMPKLDIQSLKAEFGSLFRPLFAANCLMLPSTLEDHTAAYLHGQVHGFSKQWPLYLSSLDFMVRVKSCSTEQAQHLVDHIIQRRILISEDWDNTYGNIEVLRYNASSDTSFVRGECDAAFEMLNADDSGVAKLAILIWKGSDLIYADVIDDVECPDSVGAEILAGLALLMKCRELGIEKLELWSDSKRVYGVISGSESIYMKDKNRKNCLLLRLMQMEFTELVPVFQPREIMFLTDQLMKLEGAVEFKTEKAIEMWSSELKGRTLFCITNTKWTSNLIKSYAEKRMTRKQEGFVYKADRIFYWKVEKGEKFAALSKLRDDFCPEVMYLAMDEFEEKPASLRKLVAELLPLDTVTSGSGMTTFTFIKNGVKYDKKPLVVVWDSSLYKECFEEESCIIVLIEDEEEEDLMKAVKISEMNVTTYLYLNGVEFKEEEKGKSSKGQKRSKRRQN